MTNPRIVVEATGDFRRLYAEMSQADSRFGKMGSTIKAGLAGAAIAGSAAIVKLGIDSAKSASAAEQSIGATESVFGRYADTVIKRSKQASDAVGVSANEYRELANVTGAMLASSGLPLQRVAGLTDKLTKRAADLAATFGGSTKEAIEAVSSLLRGEADPIERYGVSIKQSDVNARLAAQGLTKLEGAAKKQAEQQARIDLLFQQSAKSAGQFGREADTIAGKGQRLGAKVEDLEAKFGNLLIPVLSEGADLASEKLIPALDDLADWLTENKDEFAELGGTVKDTVVPPLKLVVDIAKGAVEVFGDLPGPVKELAVQAGVAALVLPKLTAGVSSVTSTTGGFIANVRDAEKRTAALSSAARSAAGIGGMLALANASKQSDKAISALSYTAGGAATGFAVAGPWGAAIGGGAGLLYGLADAVKTTDEAAYQGNTTWQTYAATMDQVTGATTRATRSLIAQELQTSGLLKDAAQFGISKQTIVDGILGEKKARDQLTAVLKDQQGAVDALRADPRFNEQSQIGKQLQQEAADRQNVIDKIREETGERKKGNAAAVELAAIANRIPEEVQTRIQAVGADLTARQIGELAAQYNLTPKQIQTVIKVSESDASKAEVLRIKERLQSIDDVEAGKQWRNRYVGELRGARSETDRAAGNMRALLGGVGDAKPNITGGRFGRTLSSELDALAGTANRKGATVGSNIGSGLQSGLSSWTRSIVGQAQSMVQAAIDAANRQADAHSPSRKMIALGGFMGEGLVIGLERSRPAARTAGQKLTASVLAGVDDGADGVAKALEQITSQIRKSITGKNQGKRESAYLKSLRDEYAALRANGRQQDLVAAKLDKARDRLKDLTAQYDDYSKAIRDSFTATGNVTQLGQQDDGTVKIRSLLDQLQQKVIGAERFEVLIGQLTKDGLSKASIQQLLDAGPEAALATAEAIASGGAAAIGEMNELQARLAKSGDRLGDLMADKYYGAGVDAAAGIVKGLEAEAKKLDKAAVRLANELVKAVKKALGIRSPSREFRLIADQVTDGLTLQLDANSTYVKRSGAVLASSLVKGFDNPQLSADVYGAGGRSATAPVASLRLTADALSDVQRGKAVYVDIDAGRPAGARAMAVTR